MLSASMRSLLFHCRIIRAEVRARRGAGPCRVAVGSESRAAGHCRDGDGTKRNPASAFRGALCIGCLFCLLALSPCAARADSIDEVLQGIDTSELQQIADDADVGLDVGAMIRLLSGGGVELDADSIMDWAKTRLLGELKNSGGIILALVAPLILWAVLRQIGGEESGASKAAGYVCYLTAAAALLNLFADQVNLAKGAISSVTGLTDHLIPILTALLAATGAPATAAMFTPMAALAGGMISSIVRGLILTLSTCAAALVVAGNISERIRLKGLTSLIVSGCNWTMGILMTAFLGIMTVQGILNSGYDGVSIRTARFTVDNLMPIIGGEVADTMDMMVMSASLVKNAVGVTGLVLMLSLCAGPLIRLLIAILIVRVSAAIAEPIAEGPIEKLIGQFSGVLSMLLVAMVTCMVIFVVLVGAVISSGRVLMA